MNGRERVLATLERRPVDRTPLMPITMMFAGDQAGIPYGRYAADHRLMVEAQIVTAEKFGFDYVSVISDPAREAADCGATVHYFENQPPAIDETRACLADKKALIGKQIPDPLAGPRMLDRIQGVALFKERVGGQKCIEGWVEGPCAESADLRGINHLMTDFFDDPGFVRDLFEFVLEMGLRFAKAQIEAGADILGMGDAAASLVGPKIYEEFVWPYEKRMVDGIHALGGRVRLHICGNTRRILGGMGRLTCDMYDLDWMVPMAEARAAMGPNAVLASNLDPVKTIRNGTPELITAALAQCRRDTGEHFIVAAGCEIPRGTPEANMFAMRDFVQR